MNVGHFARIAILLASLTLVSSAEQPKWQGSWAASVGSGGVTALTGTWNAVPGQAAATVVGTWSVQDRNGTVAATGTWAAGKEDKAWKGTWQARLPSGQVYDGTWLAQVELPATSQVAELFEAAIAKALSGSWAMGNHSGAFTIRATR